MRDAKAAAHAAVARAVAAGRLTPIREMRCRICGWNAAVYHHWSYADERQLDVVPLCDRCHTQVHAGRIADPTSGMFYVHREEIDPDDRGSCPWPPPPEPTAEQVAARLQRLRTFRQVEQELGAVPAWVVFGEAEHRLAVRT